MTETYDDVWFVTVSEGLDYVMNFNSYSNADLLALTETDAPFGCPPVTGVDCSPLKPCRSVGNYENLSQYQYNRMSAIFFVYVQNLGIVTN